MFEWIISTLCGQETWDTFTVGVCYAPYGHASCMQLGCMLQKAWQIYLLPADRAPSSKVMAQYIIERQLEPCSHVLLSGQLRNVCYLMYVRVRMISNVCQCFPALSRKGHNFLH